MIKNIIDNDVVQSFKNEEEDAFNTIYEIYYKKLFFFVYEHCYDEELTKDIVQNIFISAYRAKHQLKYNEAFHSWILRIANNEMIRTFKKENMKAINVDGKEDIDIFVDERQVGVEATLEYQEIIMTIQKSIQSMKDEYKDVAMLKYNYDLTNEEIASVLLIPIGTVKSRLFRANKILKDDLMRSGISKEVYKNDTFVPTIVLLLSNTIAIPKGIGISHINTILSAMKTTGLKIKIASFLGATTVIGSILFLFLNNGEEELLKYKEIQVYEPCEIIDILYNESYTGGNISLEVLMTNDIYDELLVNDKPIHDIEENGNYTVSLVYNGQIIDKKECSITNIDKESPEVLHIEEYDDIYIIYLEDKVSGLNWNSLVYYFNGVVSSNYQYDISKNTITFTYLEGTNNVFYIEDNVGNWRKVTIAKDE